MGKRSGSRAGPRLAIREFWRWTSCNGCINCIEDFLMDSLWRESMKKVRGNTNEEIIKLTQLD